MPQLRLRFFCSYSAILKAKLSTLKFVKERFFPPEKISPFQESQYKMPQLRLRFFCSYSALLKAKLSTLEHLQKKRPATAGLILHLSVDPERFELSVSTLNISVYGAFSIAKFSILKHFNTFPYSNSLLQESMNLL